MRSEDVASVSKPALTARNKAAGVQARVAAAAVSSWWDEVDEERGNADRVVAARIGGVLVVMARGDHSDRIEGELVRAGLVKFVQKVTARG